MAVIVQKFGGTSIANLERIARVAKLIAAEVEKGNQVVVVVSAMAGTTNQLISWINQICPDTPNSAEYDVVVSTGEQVTCGLLALTLQKIGIPARSWLAWQLGIQTDNKHQCAQIHSIDTKAISDSLKQGVVAIVAGFQGVNAQNRLTTLGRGGSDTTAVALAYALQAKQCDIYTDVDGIFTADPQVVPEARKLDEISYNAMLALSYHGAKVLQPQSIELALACHIPVEVRSSFSPTAGTRVVSKVTKESALVGISCDDDLALFALHSLSDAKTISAKIVSAFRKENISMTASVIKKANKNQGEEFIFTIKRAQVERAKLTLHELSSQHACQNVQQIERVANIAIVGNSISDRKQIIIDTIIQTLKVQKISYYGLIWYANKVVVIVDEKVAHNSMRHLHQAFQLEKEPTLSKLSVASL